MNTPHLKQAQKASSKDAPKIAGTGDKANMGISDLDALQGQKLEAFAHSAHPMGMARVGGRMMSWCAAAILAVARVTPLAGHGAHGGL